MLRPQVAPLAGQVEKLLRQRLGAVDLALRDEYLADTDQRAHLAERIPQVSPQLEALLETLECRRVVSDGEEGPAECVERGSEFRDVTELAPEGDAFAEQGAALVGITQPAREPAGSRERRRTDRAADIRTGTCVTAPQLVGLAGLLELLGRVLANRLEHQEAVVRDRLQEAEIDERAQRVEVRVTNLLGGGKWEAPGKDREPAEEDLRLRVEQVVTPLDRCPQCSLVFRDVPGAAGEKGQGVIEALQKQIRAQELRARRGELDRER